MLAEIIHTLCGYIRWNLDTCSSVGVECLDEIDHISVPCHAGAGGWYSCIVPLILNLGSRWGWVVKAKSQP